MILNFIFSNLNAIILITWIIFLFFICIRFFKPEWVKSISYKKIILISISIHIFYALFISWGQYYVWLNGGEFTRSLLSMPLSTDVPFSPVFEWLRPIFAGDLGYFFYYILGRFWINAFLTLIISFVLYGFFILWDHYRGSFVDNGTKIVLILMIISGWPGVLINVVLGFFLSLILMIIYTIKGKNNLKIEPLFIVSTLLSLLFTNIILSHVL